MPEQEDKLRFGVIVFPGTNCERETQYVLSDVLGQEADLVPHTQTDIQKYDCLILPGGFANGDHLRAGAIARFSPVMREVEKFAADGKPVIGICNGFQVLVETGLLPGAFLRNDSLQFRSAWVTVRVENSSMFTQACQPGQVLRILIAHGEGNYFAPDEVISDIEEGGQVLFRYSDPQGVVAPQFNPNGARNNIAGIINKEGNVMALMPHPERASEIELGSEDGKLIFISTIESLRRSKNL